MVPRLLAFALLSSLSVAPMATSRARTKSGGGAALVTTTSSTTSTEASTEPAVDISLGSITWQGDRATAVDSLGRRHALTLERQLQQAATHLLRVAKPSSGAVVVLSATDSRILALSETPNEVSRADSLIWSANTPSASLFKLVTTAALIEHAQLQPSHRVCSEGGEHRLEQRHLGAPRGGRVVCGEFSEILGVSRNAAYARLVHSHLSGDDLANFADRFGFNSPLPGDVSAELGRFRSTNDPVRLVRTATGFVGSSLSALGAAYLGLIIARGGVAPRLHLIADDLEPSVTTAPALALANAGAASAEPARPWHVISSTTAGRVRDMMEKVISHGTAADAFRDESGHRLLPQLRVAGKTGTLGRDEHVASWFVGFAPSRDPKVVVAVLLDNGPIWQTTAKRVASSLLRTYFEPPLAAQLAAR